MSVTDKLNTLHDKIKNLTQETDKFQTGVKSKLEELKPKIAEISRRASACSFNDDEARKKREELEKLLKEKDKLLEGYIKKDDLEKHGYAKLDDFNDKIQAALTDLEALMSSSASGNKEIEALIADIEKQLSDVENDIGKISNKKMDRTFKVPDNFDEADVDNSLADFFGDDDDDDDSDAGNKAPTPPLPAKPPSKTGDVPNLPDDDESMLGGKRKSRRRRRTRKMKKGKTMKRKRRTRGSKK
jgi:ElaB/YqjD/DUF883 family membrane-anchored ribosome-binding protein